LILTFTTITNINLRLNYIPPTSIFSIANVNEKNTYFATRHTLTDRHVLCLVQVTKSIPLNFSTSYDFSEVYENKGSIKEFRSKYSSLPYILTSSPSLLLFSPNFSISLSEFLNSLLSCIRISPSFFLLPHFSNYWHRNTHSAEFLGSKTFGNLASAS